MCGQDENNWAPLTKDYSAKNFLHSEMNHKLKKYKYRKSRELNSSLKNWSYSRKIAKEVVLRKEFKALKKILKIL